MFFRRVVTRRGNKEYVYLKLIENYREDGKIKQRVIANFGNIERLRPEELQAIFAGQFPGQAAKTLLAAPAARQPGRDALVSDLRRAWNSLGLTAFLAQYTGEHRGDPAPALPLLVEALAYLSVIQNPDQQPAHLRYHELDLPEAAGSEFSSGDFYRALVFLAAVRHDLERHLCRRLTTALGPPAVLYLMPTRCRFTGQVYRISTAGRLPETADYSKTLAAAVVLFPPGLPVGFRNHPAETADEPCPPAPALAGADQTRICRLYTRDYGGSSRIAQEALYVAALPAAEFGRVPVNAADAWRTDNATVHRDYWTKDLPGPRVRYVITYQFQPQTAPDHLTRNLKEAERELKRLQAAVKNGRITRENTVHSKAESILNRYGCTPYFGYRFDPGKRTFNYVRNDRLIREQRVLQGTHVLQTSADDLPAPAIAEAYHAGRRLQDELRVLPDILATPVEESQAELKYTGDFLAGRLQLQLLGKCLLSLSSARKEQWEGGS